jgi:YebC/PmpR family DNA-binding regulatory protein
MSGHNKWAQIKHKKAITDAKKGQIFGKVARELTLAARGNPDPTTNYKLKAIIDKARSVNMPQDNIERAIKRVTDRTQAALEELTFEAIGPGGAAVIISAITDSRNRTLNELKILMGSLGLKPVPPGSLQWMMHTPATLDDQDATRLQEIIEALDDHDDVQEVTTNATL